MIADASRAEHRPQPFHLEILLRRTTRRVANARSKAGPWKSSQFAAGRRTSSM